MTGRDLLELRKKAGMTQKEVADALGVSLRTIGNWEGAVPLRMLSPIESRSVREVLIEKVLGRKCAISNHLDQTFEAIPSEYIAIWLVENQSCVLLPNAVRCHNIDTGKRMDTEALKAVSPLVNESLTTYPLRIAQILNLAGEAISQHKCKKYKGTRAANYSKGGVCESLLHVPVFIPSGRGPQPVLLLTLQNKLDDNNQVKVAEPGVTSIYTPEDESLAQQLAVSFKDSLYEDLCQLAMFEFE